jgi:hypothetical protein
MTLLQSFFLAALSLGGTLLPLTSYSTFAISAFTSFLLLLICISILIPNQIAAMMSD